MLSFLRKIRKSLIEHGSTRKYLLYSIGEIALVVIGILIALQINNWNVKRLNSIEEERILLSVIQKVEFNRFQHAMGSNRYDEVIASAEGLLSSILDKEDKTQNVEMARNLHLITKRFLMGSNNATHLYDELIGSGQLGLITSHELRQLITQLKIDFELLASYELLQTSFVDNQMTPYLNKNIDRLSVFAVGSKSDSSLYDQSINWDVTLKENTDLSSEFQSLLDDQEFANLLFELLKQTRVLLPIYERIDLNLTQIDSISNL